MCGVEHGTLAQAFYVSREGTNLILVNGGFDSPMAFTSDTPVGEELPHNIFLKTLSNISTVYSRPTSLMVYLVQLMFIMDRSVVLFLVYPCAG